MDNPKAALDALLEPSPLTLGQIALLDRIESPLLHGDVASIAETARGLWLLSLPIAEACKRWRESEAAAILWLDGLKPAEYRRRLGAALDGIGAFYALLPKAEDSAKKNGTATATSPSLPNGPAPSTAAG